MFKESYSKALKVIMKKPFTLWGLSLMSILLVILASALTAPVIAIGLAIGYVITAGMQKIYLDGLDEKTVNSDQLFVGFKSFFRIAGGMAWRDLWIFIWALIPIAGPVLAICKSYQYRFVPYILMEEPDVGATEALRLSMKKTNGKKSDMFVADLLFGIAFSVGFWVLLLFAMIPYIGILFALVLIIYVLAFLCFGGLFCGLFRAYFYKIPDKVPVSYTAGPAPSAVPVVDIPKAPDDAPAEASPEANTEE